MAKKKLKIEKKKGRRKKKRKRELAWRQGLPTCHVCLYGVLYIVHCTYMSVQQHAASSTVRALLGSSTHAVLAIKFCHGDGGVNKASRESGFSLALLMPLLATASCRGFGSGLLSVGCC
jgi:hypothetical protein